MVPRTKRVTSPTLAGNCCRAMVVLSFFLVGCGPAALPAPDIICRVGSEEIKFGAFQSYLAEISSESDRALGSDVLSGLLDQYLGEELVRKFAIDEGWIAAESGRRESFATILERLHPQSMEERAIEDYYQERRQEFELPERVRLLHILVEDRTKLEQVTKALSEGDSFESVARAYSQATLGRNAGLNGQLAREDLPPAFGELVFSLSPGEISEVVEAGYGYHLFQVTERLEARLAPLNEVREAIVANLVRSLTDSALKEVEQEARERYNVRLFERNIPFNYHGRYAQSPNP